MNTAHTFHHPASRLPTFRTSPPDWTKFVCVEPSGALVYVNGDLVPKFCSVCPGMLKHRKCLRSTTIEDRAERFLAFAADRAAMKKLTRSNRENVNRVARWLKRTFKRCANCSHIARVGLRTCRVCGIAGNNAHSKFVERRGATDEGKHLCERCGVRKTRSRYCRVCAVKVRYEE